MQDYVNDCEAVVNTSTAIYIDVVKVRDEIKAKRVEGLSSSGGRFADREIRQML
jgi:hypothetical protein